MVGTVVTAAAIAAIAIAAIVSAVSAMVVGAVVPQVMAHLMLALLVVGRIIAAAARLSDRRYRKGTGDDERCQGFRVARVHVGSFS
ncbi:MAG TPA: hypothetical protein VJU80_00180 [Solirubrobacteraceae bacterium]|nr:hypothetical protein [Solirubrobacteraceae bacterium]